MITLAPPPHEKAAPPVRNEVDILRELAAGRCPFTGEVLPIESCYQSTEVVRALFAGISALERGGHARLPRHAGRGWTPEEEDNLRTRFDQGVPIMDLAKEHERTRGAIVSRLEKLGRIGQAAIVATLRAADRPAPEKPAPEPLSAGRARWKT